MPDIGVHRLDGPARYNLGSVRKLEIGLIVARRRGKRPEINLILIEATNTVGKTSVDDGCAEAVFWPIRHHAFENNPTVKIEADLVPVGWTYRSATEHRNAAVAVAIFRAIELLIDDSVNPVIATMHERHTAAGRAGQQRTVVGKALISELSEMTPTSNLERCGESSVILAAISPKLEFADHECRILQTKIQSIAVARVGIARTGAGGIAVEDREQERCIFWKLVFYPHTRRR